MKIERRSSFATSGAVKKIIILAWNILFLSIVGFSLLSCGKTNYPHGPFADQVAGGQSFECPNELPATFTNDYDYDTIITIRGDTAIFKRPYRPSTLEKAGLVVMAAFVYWCIDNADNSKN